MEDEEKGRRFNCAEIANTENPDIVMLICNLPTEGYASIIHLANKHTLLMDSVRNVLDPSELIYTFDQSIFDSTGEHISFLQDDKIVFHDKIWSQVDTRNINIVFPHLPR